jgi:hypothetical protein
MENLQTAKPGAINVSKKPLLGPIALTLNSAAANKLIASTRLTDAKVIRLASGDTAP